jgi:hypothetical protein
MERHSQSWRHIECTVTAFSGKRSGGEAHITVRNGKGRGHFGDISYVFQKYADDNTSNGAIRVAYDDYNMFLKMDQFHSQDGEKYGTARAAESL